MTSTRSLPNLAEAYIQEALALALRATREPPQALVGAPLEAAMNVLRHSTRGGILAHAPQVEALFRASLELRGRPHLQAAQVAREEVQAALAAATRKGKRRIVWGAR